ncbi:hypothetical protein [Sanyastnella coralliicola]|uniref:hypothetical protein n=1 Tax=Sanyastnella coralliicola TaxID=3069118 RepID=UPI0027B9EE72|nr:hypothetical protein [Longitalea sp. SCSIO 12813]
MNHDKIPVAERRYMNELHEEHQTWVKELEFYKEELEIFRNRLGEVSIKNNKPEERADVEHFQNQFLREIEVIDTLRHDINAHEKVLVEYAKDHPAAVEHTYFRDHTELTDRMQRFEELWKELKNDFNRFLSKWM